MMRDPNYHIRSTSVMIRFNQNRSDINDTKAHWVRADIYDIDVDDVGSNRVQSDIYDIYSTCARENDAHNPTSVMSTCARENDTQLVLCSRPCVPCVGRNARHVGRFDRKDAVVSASVTGNGLLAHGYWSHACCNAEHLLLARCVILR